MHGEDSGKKWENFLETLENVPLNLEFRIGKGFKEFRISKDYISICFVKSNFAPCI